MRAEAAARGFSVASKPDSHDICFIPDGDTRGWLAEHVGAAPGQILERDGTPVGTHEGAAAFTIGQRKGLSLGVPSPDGRPRFVVEVRPSTNEVVVGPREALDLAEIAGNPLQLDRAAHRRMPAFRSTATCRSAPTPIRFPPWPCCADGELVITPATPLNGVSTGQTAVLYAGTRVLGQCTIDRTVSVLPLPGDEAA